MIPRNLLPARAVLIVRFEGGFVRFAPPAQPQVQVNVGFVHPLGELPGERFTTPAPLTFVRRSEAHNIGSKLPGDFLRHLFAERRATAAGALRVVRGIAAPVSDMRERSISSRMMRRSMSAPSTVGYAATSWPAAGSVRKQMRPVFRLYRQGSRWHRCLRSRERKITFAHEHAKGGVPAGFPLILS